MIMNNCKNIVISLLCILIVFCNNTALANDNEDSEFCSLFKFGNRNLYEYCSLNYDRVSIILSKKYEENQKIYTAREDIIDILDMLNHYNYTKTHNNQGNYRMSVDLKYRVSLKIELNDEYSTEIIVCNSGYIYKSESNEINSEPFVYAVAYDEKQLCGLINNLYLYDVETTKNMNFCGTGNLYVDNTDMIKESVYFDQQNVLLPLRITLEIIGATVEWDDRKKCAYVTYGDKSYTCIINKPDRDNPQREILNIIDKDNPLSFSTLRGPYININDSIYLHNSTFEALIKDFGYKINIDIESHNVEIKSE